MQSWWYLAAATRGASIHAPGGRLMSRWMFPGFYGNSWLSRLTMRIQLIRCISHIQSLISSHLSSWVNARTHNNDRLASTLCCPFLVRTAGSFTSQLFLTLFHCPWLNSNLQTHANTILQDNDSNQALSHSSTIYSSSPPRFPHDKDTCQCQEHGLRF